MQMKVEAGVEPAIGDVFIWAKSCHFSKPNHVAKSILSKWDLLFSQRRSFSWNPGFAICLEMKKSQKGRRRRIGRDANEHLEEEEEEEEVHMTVDPKAEA